MHTIQQPQPIRYSYFQGHQDQRPSVQPNLSCCQLIAKKGKRRQHKSAFKTLRKKYGEREKLKKEEMEVKEKQIEEEPYVQKRYKMKDLAISGNLCLILKRKQRGKPVEHYPYYDPNEAPLLQEDQFCKEEQCKVTQIILYQPPSSQQHQLQTTKPITDSQIKQEHDFNKDMPFICHQMVKENDSKLNVKKSVLKNIKIIAKIQQHERPYSPSQKQSKVSEMLTLGEVKIEANEEETIKRKNTSEPTNPAKKVVKSDSNKETTMDGSNELDIKQEDFLSDNNLEHSQQFERELVLEK